MNRRRCLQFLDESIEMLYPEGVLFVLPASWRRSIVGGDSYHGVACWFMRDHPPMDLQVPTLLTMRAVLRFIEGCIERAIEQLAARRLTGERLIIPLPWARILGPNHREMTVFPTHVPHRPGDPINTQLRDYALGWPPRIETSDVFGPRAIYIDTGIIIQGDTVPDSNHPTELPKNVIDSAKQLINAELDSDNPSRFHRAARVADIMQQLAELYFVRVADEPEEGIGQIQGYLRPGEIRQGVPGNPIPNEIGPRVYRGNGMFGAQVEGPMRQRPGPAIDANILAALGPGRQEQLDDQRDQLSILNEHARQLAFSNLIQLRDHAVELGLDRDALNRQIQEAQHVVAHSIFLRGHSDRSNRQEDLPGPGGAGDAPGAGDAGSTPPAGQEEGLDRSGGGALRNADQGQRADANGGESPRETAQAGQEDRERGDLQGRQDRGGDRADLRDEPGRSLGREDRRRDGEGRPDRRHIWSADDAPVIDAVDDR